MAAPVRHYYLHTDPRYGLTSGLNHIKILDGEVEHFQGLGTTRLGLTIYNGDVGAPTVVQVTGTPEIAFGVWTTGAQTSDPLVWKLGGFTWDADEQAYIGEVNFNTLQLRSAFAGKVGAVENSGASYDLALADAPKLIALTHSAAFTAVLKAQADIAWTTGITLVILNNSSQVLSIDPASGVTINASNADYTVAAGDLVTLTRTAENTWTAAETTELDELTATGQWGYRTAGQPWDRSPWFSVTIRDPYVREGIATPASTLSPDAYVTDAELEAEVTAQLNAQLGTPAGGAVPSNTGATVRGEVTQVRVAGGMFGGFSLSRLKDTFSGSDLQHDVCTIEAGTLSEGAVIEFLIEGSRFQVDGYGGYRNAITIDTAEVFTFTRNEITAFDDQRIAYRLRGQMIITKDGASGAMSVSWELTERAGSTTVTSDSLPTSATSTDASAVAIDTTTDFDLGLAAAYTVVEGQRDHCITRAFMRRIL